MAELLSELKRRRMPHVLSVYVAASWGVVEAIDWLTGRYGLPGELVDADNKKARARLDAGETISPLDRWAPQ